MSIPTSPLTILALAFSAIAALIVVVFLVRRPALTRVVKIWLLLGLGVFPIGAAMAGNVSGFEATKERAFCGSCHVMSQHASDSESLASHSLAARHARNPMFGSANCYACHADYGMFGTVVTKLGGMRHVWLYATEYRSTPLDEAKKTIHLRGSFPNANCMECHSTRDELWLKKPDHRSSLDDVRAGRVSCASDGCHGVAHPFWPHAEAR